jgi:hypothetical protein
MEEKKVVISQGWIVYLDIFGFSNLVEVDYSKNIDGLYNKLEKCHKNLFEILSRLTKISTHVHIFSDSIFIFFPVEKYVYRFKILQKAIEATSQILTVFFRNNLPLRGGISFGQVKIGKNSIVGIPIIEAYKTEQNLRCPLVFLKKKFIDPENKFIGDLPSCDQNIKLKDGRLKGLLVTPSHKEEFIRYVSSQWEKYAMEGPPSIAESWWEALNFIEINKEAMKRDEK